MKKLFFLLGAICNLLIACRSTAIATGENGANLNTVAVTEHATYTLLPTTAVEKKIDTVQHFKAQFGKKEIESDCLLIADEEKLIMTIMNNFGTTMGELNYNNDLIVFNSELFPKGVKAAYIVADIQFCLYRADLIQAALEKVGLRCEFSGTNATNGTEEKIRRIYDGEKEIIHIEKSSGKITYTNFLRDYAYTLQGEF